MRQLWRSAKGPAWFCAAWLVLTMTMLAPLGAATQGRTGSEVVKVEQIDLNRSTIEELTTVPGIGAAMAGRIVQFRQDHGDFERIEDLMKVRGIGEKSLEKLRPYFKVVKRK